MKKEYEKPKIEIIVVEDEDIVTGSTDVDFNDLLKKDEEIW